MLYLGIGVKHKAWESDPAREVIQSGHWHNPDTTLIVVNDKYG